MQELQELMQRLAKSDPSSFQLGHQKPMETKGLHAAAHAQWSAVSYKDAVAVLLCKGHKTCSFDHRYSLQRQTRGAD